MKRPLGLGLCALALSISASTTSLVAQDKEKEKQPKAAARQQLPPGVKVLRDIEYAKPGGKPLALDLYLPEKSTKPLPVVMWVHGGGWNKGSKDRCLAVWLSAEGFAVASIQYRLTTEAQYPAQIEDCRAAVRWLREHAAEHNLDAKHIGAWGSSAGGHLVALMGTLDTPKDEKISSRVQAVCDWFGPSDLLTMPPNVVGNGRTEEEVAKSNGAQLLGAPVNKVPDKAKLASAAWQVSAGDAPFLIVHGDKDPGVPLAQSQVLHDKLLAAGVSSKFHIVKDGAHGGKEFDTPEVKTIVREFFSKALGVHSK